MAPTIHPLGLHREREAGGLAGKKFSPFAAVLGLQVPFLCSSWLQKNRVVLYLENFYLFIFEMESGSVAQTGEQ